jgi:hypothetical protein
MKNSGGEPEGNADDVLDLGRWHTKVVGDVREAIAGLEAIYEVLHARPTVNHERLSERLVGIHEHLCGAIGREMYLLRPSVVAVADRLEVVADDLREVLLSGAHDRQERFVVAALRVIEDQLGPVGVDPFRDQRVVETDLRTELCDRGRIRCIGTPALRSALSTNASAKPTKGTVADRPARGNTITNGSAPFGRAH